MHPADEGQWLYRPAHQPGCTFSLGSHTVSDHVYTHTIYMYLYKVYTRTLSLSVCVRVQLVVQSVDDNTLEQLNSFSPPSSQISPHSHSPTSTHMWEDMGLGMEGGGRGVATGPTPFSTKKDRYSGKGGTQVHVSMYIYTYMYMCMHAFRLTTSSAKLFHLSPTPPPHTELLVLLEPVRRWKNLNSIQCTSSQSQYYINCLLPSVCDCTYPASTS